MRREGENRVGGTSTTLWGGRELENRVWGDIDNSMGREGGRE